MEIKRINTGPRMSDVVVHGGLAYLSGKVPTDMSVGIKGQTEQVLTIVDELLAQAGTDKSKLLRAEIYLSDIRYFDEMNAVWDAWVAPGTAPSRATIGALMAKPECLVEVMVIAVV